MRTSSVFVLLALLCGCGSKSTPGSAIPAASGGSVEDAAGARLRIPAGALAKDAVIELTKAPPETHAVPGVSVIGPVWSLKVDGAEHVKFLKPVELALPFDPALRKAGSEPRLSLWTGTQWLTVPGSRLDPASGKVVAQVDHFSEFAPTQDAPGNVVENAIEAQRKRWFNNQFWYGRVVVTIHGSGQRKNESYSIQRDAEISFRIPAMPGEAAMESAFEQMKKSPVALPPEALRGLQDARNRRHWMTQLQNKHPEDETDAHIAVHDAYKSTSGKADVKDWSRQSNEGGLDRKLMGLHQMEIDIVKGTYSYGAGQISGPKVVYSSSSSEQPEKSVEGLAMLDVRLKDEKLPESGTTISGIKRIPKDQLTRVVGQIGGNWSYSFGRTRGTIAWTFSPVPFEDVELVLVPRSYDDWLPHGGPDTGTKGNSLPLQVRLQKRGGGPTTARMTQLTVRLSEVSREPGVCLNVPTTKGADTPDLKFAAGAGFSLEDEDTRVVKKGAPFESLNLTLDCYDWGAWGAVSAQAQLEDGRTVLATLDGDPSEDELRVPKRPPESKIADKWKKDQGTEAADLDDKDPQNGNRNDGDGLTLYEEYRGLVAKGKHTREHPPGPDGVKPLTQGRKDVIVNNRIGPIALAGLRLLEKAAGLHVVELEDNELPVDREVNVNRGPKTTAGAQHGLILVDVALPGDDVGSTPRDDTKPAGSREQYAIVRVDLAKIRRLYATGRNLPWPVTTEISETVAHELAHALSVDHHGPGRLIPIGNPSILQIYDRSKKLVTVTQTPDGVGEPGNEASGNVQCIMCYNGMYQWSYQSPTYLFQSDITPPGSLFCTSLDGTGHNAPFDIPDPQNPALKKRIPGVFGRATIGPCLPMMKVRDQK